MRIKTFRISTYLTARDAFHFARKHLEPVPPPLLHTHDFYELFWVEEGATHHWINGEKPLLRSGEIAFIRPGDIHGFEAAGRTRCRIVNVMFRKETAQHLLTRYRSDLRKRCFWSGAAQPETVALTGAQMERVRSLSKDLEGGPRSLAKIETFLLNVMTSVLTKQADVPAQAPGWLVTACHAAQRPEVFREGARGFVLAAGRSHEHVCRAAQAHLGMSPTTYVNGKRMAHAAQMLTASDESISAIALDCGIENISHFYRIFKRHFGVTPRAYRQHNQRDPVQPGLS
ncbi:MAG: AraC family transcriptional regulator [Pseudomonadota bacterium]